MACPSILSLISVYCLLYFGSTLSLAATVPATGLTLSALEASGNLKNLSLSSPERKWYWVSGDGTQILPINGPQDIPKPITASSGAATAPNGHSYTFSFGNYHGATTPRPSLAKFLFNCEFGLFDQTPASGQGVWTPYPGGKYACMGNLPGEIRIKVVRNVSGWKMAIHDIAFLIKVVHDIEGIKDESQFFDFVVNYTNNLDAHPYQTVAAGEWEKLDASTTAATSSL